MKDKNMVHKELNLDLVETGEKIRNKREALGVSQERLAEYIGVSINSISRYETGSVSMRIDTFYSIAELFGVSPNDLAPKKLTSDRGDVMQVDKTIERFLTLNEKNRRIVCSMVNALIDELE